ncbi:MAG: hypothetical protein WAU76_19295 [Candidatus Sulfotelmatobacter sp.]
MTGKPKLADVKYEVKRMIAIPGAVGPPYKRWEKRRTNRYTVRSSGNGAFAVWDKQENCWALGEFRTRAATWKYLRTTTERKYKLWRLNRALDEVEHALDRGAA